MVFFTFTTDFYYTPSNDPTITYRYRDGYAGEVADDLAIQATAAKAGFASGVTIELDDDDHEPEGE